MDFLYLVLRLAGHVLGSINAELEKSIKAHKLLSITVYSKEMITEYTLNGYCKKCTFKIQFKIRVSILKDCIFNLST